MSTIPTQIAEPAGGSNLITGTIHRRPLLPALNLLLAVAAVVISAYALATTPELPTLVPAPRTLLDPASDPRLPGCNLGIGTCEDFNLDE